ncbi:hypothetical protein BU26DRAFT_150506 [Trematosphaeria pertusa]|uniref:Uncharacterized protein n=1 Tax=Trematosphaeria pertusa TaxID=390896 RepID=A0A6A6IXN0_9PLEO|nr:uncharacterized protein BU26DRAFT_150506 [Trematosphaeria pertusa]KAF2255068.1 hypothetical protein BU26DRAFT_150506 [Trematosphaeria pertusa]
MSAITNHFSTMVPSSGKYPSKRSKITPSVTTLQGSKSGQTSSALNPRRGSEPIKALLEEEQHPRQTYELKP